MKKGGGFQSNKLCGFFPPKQKAYSFVEKLSYFLLKMLFPVPKKHFPYVSILLPYIHSVLANKYLL